MNWQEIQIYCRKIQVTNNICLLSFIFRTSYLFLILGFTCVSCKSEDKNITVVSDDRNVEINDLLYARYKMLLNFKLDSTTFPRSFSTKKKYIKYVSSKDWTSGFFAGNLW